MDFLRVGHSPDPDDAFMFFPLATGAVRIEGFQVQQVLEDIESLNLRAARGELEVTAVSAAMYPLIADQYRIMACGASVGRKYGPILLTRQTLKAPLPGGGKGASPTPLSRQGKGGGLSLVSGKRVGIPGVYTTAYLLFRIYMPHPFEPVFLPFDAIPQAISDGVVDAGLIIHEGQLTWRQQGFAKLLDLGEAWGEDTGLPIPLGLDLVHRRLGPDTSAMVTAKLAESIRYTMAHEDEAVNYAMAFGRGIDRETCRRFVRMYVNADTLNLGEEGKQALETLYGRALDRNLIPSMPPLDIIGLE